MEKWVGAAMMAAMGIILPQISHAQGVADSIGSLQEVLDKLYDDMINNLGEKLIGIGQGIGGFAAVFYIGSRVWKNIANAEPVDVYPLLRPFALGLCVMFFPLVLNAINGVLKPTVMVTEIMVKDSNKAIAQQLKRKAEAIKTTDEYKMYVGINGEGNRDEWYKYTHENKDPADEDWIDGLGNDFKFAVSKATYNFQNSIKTWMSEILNVLFQAAALCINTLRTFQLIVLGILGPLVFSFSIFDGLQNTLTSWISRYINIYLWLPVANIFGAIIGQIQENMIANDINQIQLNGTTFFSSTDAAYLVFLVIGIIGYFTVPTVAGYIINAGSQGSLVSKVTNLATNHAMSAGGMAGSAVSGAGGMVAGRAAQTISNIKNARENFNEGQRAHESSSGENRGKGTHGHIGRVAGHVGSFLHERLKGNS